MKHRDSVRRTAGSGDSRWWTAFKLAAVVAVGALAVGWGITVDENQRGAYTFRLPESRSGKWISSLPLEVAEAPPVLNTTEPGVELGKDRIQAGSYPAVTLGPALDGVEAQRLDSLMLTQYPPEIDTTTYTRWWEAGPHPYLDSILPGARYLVVRWYQPVTRYGNMTRPGYRSTYVLFNGLLFPVEKLAHLLVAAGFDLDSADAPIAARVAVLLWAFEKATSVRSDIAYCFFDLPSGRESDTTSAVIPSIEFRSLDWGEWWNAESTSVFGGIWVDCTIGGTPRRIFVRFQEFGSRGQIEPIWLFDGAGSIRFDGIWPFPPPNDDGNPQGRILRDGDWTLQVSGDVWTEQEGGSGKVHHFLLADSNGTPTHHKYIFTVTGVSTQQAFLVFDCQQGKDTFSLKASVNGQVATLEWEPGYDSTAEYVVWASPDSNGSRESNIEVIDPEAWLFEQVDPAGKYVKLRYMKSNDRDGSLDARETADTLFAGIRAAWDVYVPLMGGCYPLSHPQAGDDTLEVILADTMLGWYHYKRPDAEQTGYPYPPRFVGENVPRPCGWYIWVPCDWDLQQQGYIETRNGLKTTAAHELWHACQLPLRAYWPGSEMMMWIEEGMATAVPTIVFDHELLQAGGRNTQYRSRVSDYLGDGLGCFPYDNPGNPYGFAAFWRHLYEHDSGSPAILVKVCEKLDSVWGGWSLDSVMRTARRRIDCALAANGSQPYANFDAALSGFHCYCCLTQYSGWWTAGGPGGFYPPLSCDDDYAYDGKVHAMPTRTTDAQTGYAYLFTKSGAPSGDVYLTFDGDPDKRGQGLFPSFEVSAVRIDGGQVSFQPFALDQVKNRGVVSFPNADWDTIFVCVTNCDADPNSDGKHKLVLSPQPENVGTQPSGQDNDDWLIIRPRNRGQDPDGPVHFLRPSVWVYNRGATLDSFEVCCSITQDGVPAYFDRDSLYVAPGESTYLRFDSVFDYSSGEYDSVYQMLLYTDLENDMDRSNDTTTRQLSIKDTTLVNRWIPDLPFPTWQHDSCYYGYEPYDELDPEHLLKDGNRTRHRSKQASCWHLRDGADGFPWDENQTKYMCLRWHGGKLAGDTFWTPYFSCVGGGNVRVRFRHHLVRRPYPDDPFVATIMGATDGSSHKPDVELFRFETGGPGADTLEGDTTVNMLWAKDPGRDNSDRNHTYLKLCYVGDSTGIRDWCVDDLRILPESIPARDVAAQEVLWPGKWTQLVAGEELLPVVKVCNYGDCAETCDVYLRVKRGETVVYDDSIPSVSVPLRSKVWVELPARTVDWSEGDNYYAESWVASPEDECPGNDTTRRYGISVLPPGFAWVANNPFGKVKQGSDLTSDGEFIYVKNVKKETVCRYHPGFRCWDTIQKLRPLSQWEKMNSKSGGLVCVDTANELYVHWRKDGSAPIAPIARLRLDRPAGNEKWDLVWPDSASIDLRLTTAMVWDGNDTIFALNRSDGSSNSIHSLAAFSLSGKRWTTVATLPCKVKVDGGLCIKDRILYLAGLKDMGYLYRLDLNDDRQWHQAGLIPGNRAKVASLEVVGGHIYLLRGGRLETDGMYRYDTDSCVWSSMLEHSPWKIQPGACMTAHGSNLYVFPGKKTQDFYRYVIPQDEKFWREVPASAPVLPTQCLTPGVLYGEPRLLGGTDPGGGQEVLVDTGDFEALSPRWSPDGAWLAYLREDDGGTMQVYRCPAEGGPAQPVTDDGFDKEDLDWSPDGQWVVFQFTDEDGYCRIGKIRADGSEYSVLTPGFKDSECPRWSPDGSLITYQQTDQYSHTQVWSMDSSGTNHSQLTYGDLDHDQPVPGSDHVYYEREANGWTQIYRVGYGGGGETQVTSSMNEHARPRISPDGKWLACERDDATGYTQVCVVDLDLFTEEAVTSSNCDNEWPGFTPDCEYVVFCASDGVGSQQCEVPVSGGAVEPLTTVSDECYAPACSPNGKWVAYSKEDSTLSEVGLFKTRRFLGDSITVFLLDDSVVDVTRDSLRVDFSIEGDAWVVLRVKKGGTAVRTLIDSVWMEAGDYTYHWNGKKSDGKLALPGADYVVRIDAHGDTGWPGYDQKSLRVKGTLVPATIGVSSTWTTTNDPYVITGHNLEFSGAGNLNLTVNHGVRVMFTQDATRHGIIVGNGERIVAGGTQQDSVYFMPHRKMADQFNPQGRGWWSGIHFNYDSRGADFDYSVFENGGGGTDAAVLYVQTPVAGTLVDLDHCRLRGSAGKGIAVYTETAGERVDFDYSVFSHCADYPVYEVKAPAVAGVVATCSFVNNDINGLAVHSGGVDEVISTSCTWPCCGPGWHYDPDEDLEIWSATGYPVLTLGAGATIRMQAGKVIRVGYAEGLTMRRGALKAVGTPGEFISFEGDGGDEWSGLWVNYDPGDSTSFRYCVFRDGTGQSRDIQDGIDYHPMLYLDETSSEVSRCKFLEAWRSAGDERGVGLFVRKGHPYIQECKFLDNECGLLADLRDETSSCTTEYCQFDGNYLGCYVTDLDADAPARLRYCNLWDNSAPAVDDDDSPYFDARNNWWGPYGSGDNRGKPYEGGNDGYTGNVLWSPWSTTEFAIWAHDAGAVSIAHPTGWELPGVLVPRALARNYLDEPVTVVARMKIGSVYEDSVEAVLAGSATDTVFFPPALLDSGYYQVSFKVRLDGDENPGNDSVGTTVWVRDSVNAAAVAVTAPADTVTIEDTIAPAVRIANLGPGTTNVPVVFWLDSVVVETVYAEVAPLETTEVCFTERGFGKGGHELRFACCLALDDDRSNDTVATSVYVKTGDFWVAESAPPLDQARLCWAGGYIYAADRASAAVHRYDIGDGDWSAVAEPPVSGVYGITALDGQVYLLGSPGSDGGGSSGGLRAAGAVRARAGRDALAGFGTEAGFSAGPQLLRYEPAGDTWELVTECDSTVVLGSATALVADRSTALYL
ncbi:MAG: PD40 domain-containing protein, partial [Micromonosporaceae bacterium]|nr:PD40 domain-containing protein [Micromonosporaceae bacterium]